MKLTQDDVYFTCLLVSKTTKPNGWVNEDNVKWQLFAKKCATNLINNYLILILTNLSLKNWTKDKTFFLIYLCYCSCISLPRLYKRTLKWNVCFTRNWIKLFKSINDSWIKLRKDWQNSKYPRKRTRKNYKFLKLFFIVD